MGVSGIPVPGGPTPDRLIGSEQEIQAQAMQDQLQASVEAMQMEVNQGMIFDTEVQGASRQQLKGGRFVDMDRSKAAQEKETLKSANTKTAEAYAEYLASMSSEDIMKKRKIKKTKWEEKLEEMALIEGAIDETQLKEEEKGIFQKFFDNMGKLRRLRKRLKELEDEENRIQDALIRQRKQEADDRQSGS